MTNVIIMKNYNSTVRAGDSISVDGKEYIVTDIIPDSFIGKILYKIKKSIESSMLAFCRKDSVYGHKGGCVVRGYKTNFLADFKINQKFCIGNCFGGVYTYSVQTIVSNTVMTINENLEESFINAWYTPLGYSYIPNENEKGNEVK